MRGVGGVARAEDKKPSERSTTRDVGFSGRIAITPRLGKKNRRPAISLPSCRIGMRPDTVRLRVAAIALGSPVALRVFKRSSPTMEVHVTVAPCLWKVCFIPLDAKGPKLFGYPEFLAGLALMVLAWTIADARYRFRVKTAPIPLRPITFFVVAIVGVLTLLTDLWRAEQWLVPKGNLLSPAAWQAILAGAFLITFLTWAWFAFIKPPSFGKRNAKWYARALYQAILKGVSTELAVVAEELVQSAGSIIHHATDGRLGSRSAAGLDHEAAPMVERLANDMLLLIADKRFCRAIVESSPVTALAIFQEMGDQNKYAVNVSTFAKNLVSEAIANKDSFLYNEAEGYESGLIGYHKPLSQAMFGNYRMVETIGSLMDSPMGQRSEWDAEQWGAYCRVVLMTFRDYVEKGADGHSVSLFRAKAHIEEAASDLYKINGVADLARDSDVSARLRVAVEFMGNAVEILNKAPVPEFLALRIRGENTFVERTFYDHLAEMIFEVIFNVSSVASPWWECWSLQHNLVWTGLFNSHKLDNAAGRVVKFKVRRMIYDEIKLMNELPNFKGAKILGYCLNVMGLSLQPDGRHRGGRALHKVVLAWTRRNYVWLYRENHRVGEACLMSNISYDAENCRIVKTYPADGLRREPSYVYLELAPPPKEAEPEPPREKTA